MSTSVSGTVSGETSIKVILFSGKKDEWDNWKEFFLIKASMKGYEEILTGEETTPETHNPRNGKKKTLTPEDQEIADKNRKGFGELILSIDHSNPHGKIAFAIVKNSKTEGMPNGDLHLVYCRLKKKFEPSTTPQLMQLTKTFHSKVLGKHQDPDTYITEMESLRIKLVQLNHNITEQALILHVLNNLNEQYDMEIKMLEHKINIYKEEGKGRELSIEDVRLELNLRYERIKNTNRANNIDHAYYLGTKFKGKCHWCGKIGHKLTERRTRIAGKPRQQGDQVNQVVNNNNGFSNRLKLNGNKYKDRKFCTYCNKKGQTEGECRAKKRDENTPNDSALMVKELACLVKEEPDASDEYTTGTCVCCGRWGPAFSYCGFCGEDSGMYFQPEPNTDYNNPNNEPSYHSEEETDTEEEEDAELFDIERIQEPTYIRNWHPLMVKTHKDPFRDIPIENLFSLVYDNMQSHRSINLGDKDEYVYTMKHQMNCFKYYSITMILQNIDKYQYKNL
jgi:hypothetical protein